ncbi:MAG: putative O-glycosylation ligase, exosortase A system-associated [Geminicoccaceae bacterium]
MRDLIFVSFFTPLPLLSLIHPWSGLLACGWVAFLKPQSFLWSFAGEIPFNLIIALSTALGWTFSRESKKFDIDLTTLLLGAFILVIGISTFFSLTPTTSHTEFSRVMKSVVFLFMLKVMLTTRVRIHGYIWLMAFVMGYFGLNGGTLFIVTGGSHQLAGPPQSEIGDRNHLALAMLLAVPLMNYLRMQSRQRWMQIALMGAMIMTVLAVLATYSRGGLIGLLAMGAFLWWRSRSRTIALVGLLVLAVGLYSVTPDSWKQRMGTIETAQTQDSSFKLRLLSWYTHFNAAVDRPLTGAGLYALQHGPVFHRYAPGRDVVDVANNKPRAAHSIYFQVLGDTGFVGFFLYLALLATGFWNALWVHRHTKRRRDLEWMGDLARMIQVSMVAFCIAGAGLSMAFYDYFLSLLVVMATVRRMAAHALAERQAAATQHQRVDTSAIVQTWRSASRSKGFRRHPGHARQRLLPNSSAPK